MVPVERGLGAGVVAQGVEEVGAVLVHAVVDLDCFILFSLSGTVRWVGKGREVPAWLDRTVHLARRWLDLKRA